MRTSRRVSILLLTALVLCAISGIFSCGSETEEVAIEAESIIVGFGDGTDNLVLTKGSPEFSRISDEVATIVQATHCYYAGLLSQQDMEEAKLQNRFVEIWFSEPVTLRSSSRGHYRPESSIEVMHVVMIVRGGYQANEIVYFPRKHPRPHPIGSPEDPLWYEWGSRRSFRQLERLVNGLR